VPHSAGAEPRDDEIRYTVNIEGNPVVWKGESEWTPQTPAPVRDLMIAYTELEIVVDAAGGVLSMIDVES
jgi:hypothetical protein